VFRLLAAYPFIFSFQIPEFAEHFPPGDPVDGVHLIVVSHRTLLK
jgi:hypothetical protein